jgi:hypothetical protein
MQTHFLKLRLHVRAMLTHGLQVHGTRAWKRAASRCGTVNATRVRRLCLLLPSRTQSGSGAGLIAGQEVHDGIRAALAKHAPAVTAEPLDRFAFYERADTAFAIVQCVGERVRIYPRPPPCLCLIGVLLLAAI